MLEGRTARFSPFQAIPTLFVESLSVPRLGLERHYKCLKISVQDCCELFQHEIELSFGTMPFSPFSPPPCTFKRAVFGGRSWAISDSSASDESKNEVFYPPNVFSPSHPVLAGAVPPC